MDSVQQLLNHVLQRNMCIVFGNLGRDPITLHKHLVSDYKHLEIIVITRDYFPESENIHVNVPISHCDLLVYMEPLPNFKIEPIKSVSCIVAFTSHMVLNVPASMEYVCYYNTSMDVKTEMCKATKLLELQDLSIEVRFAKYYADRVDYFDVKTVATKSVADIVVMPNNPYPILNVKTYLILDVTQLTKIVDIFLSLLTMFDFMKRNVDKIDRWMICFPPGSMEKFDAFVQRHIDILFCKRRLFKELMDVLFVTPFRNVSVPNFTKVDKYDCSGYKLHVPKSKEEEFTTHLKYDVIPLGKEMLLQV